MFRKRHPKALYLLFLTELWERFGFYAQQTILVLYMSQALRYSDQEAFLVYGAFSAMLYLTPTMGGYLADRFLGFQKAILLGSLLFIIGYLLTAIPGNKIFFLGLSFVIIANGFFKPNVSTLVGDLYTANDPRREGGFTLFYMGINIGSLIPPLFIGSVVKKWGWHWGFLLAAIGMIISFFTFLTGRKVLGNAGAVPKHSILFQQKWKRWFFHFLLFIGIVISLFVFYTILQYPIVSNAVLVCLASLVLVYVFFSLTKQEKTQRDKMIAALILILISTGFWAVYNQTYTSLMLFAKRNMEKSFLGLTIDPEFTQFFNPFFIVIFSPILSVLWTKLEERKTNPSIPMKFSFGIVFMAIGFLLLSFGTTFSSHFGQTSAWWLVMSYFFQTLGELLLSPIGLSMITKLSPKNLMGLMMGVWFLTQSASYAIGSDLALFAEVPKKWTAAQSLPIYTHAFLIYGLISIALAIVSFAFVPYLNKLISGKTSS